MMHGFSTLSVKHVANSAQPKLYWRVVKGTSGHYPFQKRHRSQLMNTSKFPLLQLYIRIRKNLVPTLSPLLSSADVQGTEIATSRLSSGAAATLFSTTVYRIRSMTVFLYAIYTKNGSNPSSDAMYRGPCKNVFRTNAWLQTMCIA